MTRALQASIAANVLLAATCSFLLFWDQQPAASDANLESPASSSTPPAFDWKLLDSPDFPAFIANLRFAGCPEATVRDIITGEVGEIYAQKERQLTAASPSGAPAQSTAQLQAERDRTIASLLEPAPSSTTTQTLNPSSSDPPGFTGASTQTPVASQRARGPTYPAVFAHNAAASSAAQTSSAPQVSPQEQAMLDKINNDFVNAVGGTNQDPNDPAYQFRWDAAQQMSDAQYKKFFGGRAYVRMQIEAARSAAVGQQTAAQ